MKLKERLKLIADKIPYCETICDIGTDHGYIPIFAVQKGICKKAIAADVVKGPLEAAEGNIRKSHLEDRIETRLGSGLEPIGEEEADVIVIAGMGGTLIAELLDKDVNKAQKAYSLVLQPMSNAEMLREWLLRNGFEIFDEELTAEGEKIYNVICARWTGFKDIKNEIDLIIGEKLIVKKDPLLKKYILRKIKLAEKVIDEIERVEGNKNNDVLKKYFRIKLKLQDILSGL